MSMRSVRLRFRQSAGRAVAGVLLALLGSGALTVIALMLTIEDEALSRLGLQLGLAGVCLISGAAQVAVIMGLWLLWTAVERANFQGGDPRAP